MPFMIYNGVTGTYKTSSLVKDQLVKAVYDGLEIHTNFLGMTEDRVRSVLETTFPKRKIPDSFRLYDYDRESISTVKKFRRFFHWLPENSVLFIDEIQIIFPAAKEMDETFSVPSLDYPGGREQANIDNRPANLSDALTLHRQYNWRIFATTQDMILVKKTVLALTDFIYTHNKAVTLGLGSIGRSILGDYTYRMHKWNKQSSTSTMGSGWRRMPKYIFNLYDSTKSGEVTQEIKTKSPFISIKFIVGFSVVLFFFYYLIFVYEYRGVVDFKESEEFKEQQDKEIKEKKNVKDNKTAIASSSVHTDKDNNKDTAVSDISQIDWSGFIDEIKFHGCILINNNFPVCRFKDKKGSDLSLNELTHYSGLEVYVKSQKLVQLTSGDYTRLIIQEPLNISDFQFFDESLPPLDETAKDITNTSPLSALSGK